MTRTAGVPAELAMALGAARVVSSLLHEVAPHDALSYALATALRLSAALFTAPLPAVCASRVDPVETLHQD